jgi:hypothetical protein
MQMAEQNLQFPEIAKPVYPLDEDYEDIGLSAGFEDGAEQSRARFTRSRRTWTLRWTALSDADYQRLMDFWANQVKGNSMQFAWRHPLSAADAASYQVRFVEKKNFQLLAGNVWSGEVTLREV